MDDIERAAVADEGYDPDDPGVIAALARVSAVLTKVGPLLREASAALDEQTDSREELLRAHSKRVRAIGSRIGPSRRYRRSRLVFTRSGITTASLRGDGRSRRGR